MPTQQEMDELSAAAMHEIERLRDALCEASVKLKLLYMSAGLGTTTGREALAALNAEIEKIDAAVLKTR